MFMQIIHDWIVTVENVHSKSAGPLVFQMAQEDLETFCKIIRKNGWLEYSVKQCDVYGAQPDVKAQSQAINR